jgi:MerR family mercuric resistance operon transcriptional regulator
MDRETIDEKTPVLPIGVLAKRTGLTVEGVRFYEKAGILAAPARTSGGQRLYGLRELKRLSFIRRARELGFTLDEVRALLRLVDEAPDRSCSDARGLAAGHLRDVRSKIAALRRMETALSDMVRRCDEGGDPNCPLIETLFSAKD